MAKCTYHTAVNQHTFAVNGHAVTPPCICFLTTFLLWELVQLEKQKEVTFQWLSSLVRLAAQTLTLVQERCQKEVQKGNEVVTFQQQPGLVLD